MPTPGRIRITKNSQLTNPLLDYRGVSNNFIEWNGQFQITEFENDPYLEFDFEENEWYFNLYATLPGTYLNDLLDVTITNLSDKNILSYNILTQQWENSGRLTEAEQDIAGINTEISNINNEISDINTSITSINQTITTNQTSIQNQVNTINSPSGSTAGGIVPEGGIIMWSGTTVPAGWTLCDGSNGTPNLVDRFIIGSTVMNGEFIASNENPFVPGGDGSPSSSTTVSLVLNENNLPPHTHNLSGGGTVTTSAAGAHTHTIYAHDNISSGNRIAQADSADGYTSVAADSVGGVGDHTHTVNLSGISVGNGGFDNDPIEFTISPKKYYALAFIMRKYGTASRDYTQPPSTSGTTFNGTFGEFEDPNNNQTGGEEFPFFDGGGV